MSDRRTPTGSTSSLRMRSLQRQLLLFAKCSRASYQPECTLPNLHAQRQPHLLSSRAICWEPSCSLPRPTVPLQNCVVQHLGEVWEQTL